MEQGRRWPALDGLRGVAVLMVVVDHAFGLTVRGYPAGIAGVMIFFALSGFLISNVIATARQRGQWSMRQFLTARVVRLVPALWAMELVVVAWWLLLGGKWADIGWQAIAAAFYVSNIFQGYFEDGLFTHTWSLGVEEQFYLLWPLLIPIVLRARRPFAFMAVGVSVSIVLRLTFAMTGHAEMAYVSLPANAFVLLLGCLLVVDPTVVRGGRGQRSVAGLGLMVIFATTALGVNAAAAYILVPIAIGVIAPVVVAASLPGVPWLEVRWLRFVGRISYALYLWHWPVLILTGRFAGGWSSLPAIALSFVLAVASTLLLEEPLRRAWKARARRPVAAQSLVRA